MPWSGGVYTRGYPSWTNDANSNLPISATKFDTEDNDFASGLNNCITKDGLSQPTAAMNWNGQNLSGVALLTAQNLTVTGVTVPANGIYLPSANTLGFATASNARGSINSTGNWNIASPTSGVALTANAVGNSTAILAVASDGQGSIFLQPQTGAGSYGLSFVTDSTGAKIGTNSNSRDLQLQTNSISGIKLTTAQVAQALDDGGTFQTLGWRDCPVNFQGAAYQLVLADRGKAVVQQNAFTITIPANGTTAFPNGTTIVIANIAASSISIAITTDTLTLAGTASTGTRTLAANGIATIIKTTSTTWLISGAGVT